MRYRLIIQELKESADHNVLAFVREVEHMKRLTAEQRQYYLKHRHETDAVRILVTDFIPYIIRVAYDYQHIRSLSILDYINEGIIGAYEAFDKCDSEGKRMIGTIRTYIKRYISNMAQKRDCLDAAEYIIEEDDLEVDERLKERTLIDELDREQKGIIMASVLANQLGSRDAQLIIDYYTNADMDIKIVAKKYGVSRERARQITQNFSPLYKNVDNLWALFSKDFNLPVHEADFNHRIRH